MSVKGRVKMGRGSPIHDSVPKDYGILLKQCSLTSNCKGFANIIVLKRFKESAEISVHVAQGLCLMTVVFGPSDDSGSLI